MSGLSDQQIKQLEGMKGINQTLLGTYKKNKAGSTPKDTVANAPEDAAGRISSFGSALNTAIDQARKQRQDSTLDMVGGMIPAGALPATSFASVLNSFNSSSAPIENTILDGALNAVEDQEKRKEEIKTEIRDLALKVGQNGGSQDTVNAIAALIESGDINSAVRVAATGLASKGVVRTGNSLVDDKGNPVWEISNTSLWDSGQSGPILEVSQFNDKFNDTKVVSTAELKTEMDRLLKENFVSIHTALKNDTARRDFMNDWVQIQEATGKPVDPVVYLKEWMTTRGLGEVKTDTAKTETKVEWGTPGWEDSYLDLDNTASTT